ncbi:isochorismatase family protein [Streptomyces halstedii]|uniref:isochorismatase family protein n=1 Tax=Streptomyces TaxID=1883 RepID=UPI00048C40F9|nr:MULTISPECIES: isochorismatase family protein [Streptomyces]MYQ52768.1 isochorismatase family protein [Streptomyces sp. SID4941]MYR72802.1 isochorismatase family protein [Streptomyces sp. SID4925]MYY19712.1 isochorismatase family protein [Streptomyces sp. SID4912]SBU95390.1 bifunctional isochorismate lyase / aryl carrier protein [Streptomyces sp. OspMP-M45]SCD68957.1 bifunctional isochorismate lyase / aryl carrier protein [Streptomyces sp. DpondAA-D4]
MAIPTIEPYPMPTQGDMPANTASWSVDPSRAVLLVHDMQYYFLRPFPAGASPVDDLLGNTVRLRQTCARLGVPVAYTAQPGDMTDEQRGLLRDFWGPGMSAGPRDRAVVDELAPGPDDTVFTKWRPSAFFRTGLLDLLRDTGRDQLIVCGVYAHVGILMTTGEACAHDIQTFVVGDAVADFTPADHRMTLEYVATRCGMTVTTKTVLRQLEEASGT